MSNSFGYDYLFKIIIIGDSGVGKTSLLRRFSYNITDNKEDEYSDKFISTIGVDFRIVTIPIDNKIAKLQIWDTAGQERFRTLASSYYRGVSGVMLVYDTTDMESFENIKYWINEVGKNATPNVIKMLVGTKSDMIDKRKVPLKVVSEFAYKENMLLADTSSKININVDNAFKTLAKTIKDSMSNSLISRTPYAIPNRNRKHSDSSFVSEELTDDTKGFTITEKLINVGTNLYNSRC
jgi:Ras-related protein Rab-1A